MATAKVLDLNSKEVGDIELPDVVFDVPINEPLIHEAVRSFLANRRAGTSATKTRGDVSGAGRKLWKQKGTGRARKTMARTIERAHKRGKAGHCGACREIEEQQRRNANRLGNHQVAGNH